MEQFDGELNDQSKALLIPRKRGGATTGNSQHVVADKVEPFENVMNTCPQKVQDKKRPRKDAEEDQSNNQLSISASSSVEDRREQ